VSSFIIKITFLLKKVIKNIKYIRQFPEVSDSQLQRFSTWDPELGWCPKAGMRKEDSVSKRKSSKSVPYWTIDQNGSRITYKSKPTKNANFSIYGDSFAMGREVYDEETIAWQLGEIYNTYCSNYGVGNYGLDQSLMRLERCIERDSTDFVCVVVCPATMARTISIYKHWLEQGNTLGVKPRAYIDSNCELAIFPNIVKQKEGIKYMYKNKDVLKEWDGNYKYFIENRLNLFRRNNQEYILQLWIDYKDLFFSLMKKYNDLSKKYHFSPMFILLADKGVAKKRLKGEYLQYQTVIDDAALEFPDIDFCDFTLDLYDNIELDDAYIVDGGGHFSPQANRMIAEMIGAKALSNRRN